MLKKIDVAKHFLYQHYNKLRCPVCHHEFSMHNYSLSCSEGHQFDLSKKGTIYFLSHTIKTEYDKNMLMHRGRMIQSGLYAPILDVLFPLITQEGTTVDVGCGEGSFIAELANLGLQGIKIGFDISKEGIYLASHHLIDVFWCVADLTNLPFKTSSVDTLVNIFSPSHYKEFRRVLKNGGTVIKVIPEENYLKELRMAFYPDDTKKQNYSNKNVIKKFADELDIIFTQRVSYTFKVPEENRLDLLEMSPLEWNVSEKVKHSLQKEPLKEITIDVRIVQGKRK